jgi:uncharacterized protein
LNGSFITVKIRIEDIDEQGLDVLFEGHERWGEYLPSHEKFSAVLNIVKRGDNILIRGDLEVIVHLECSRCLANYDMILNNPIDNVLVPHLLMSQQKRSELTEEELNLITYEGPELDIDDIIQEHLVLSLPVKPLCMPECAGLCPQCGVNRNIESCTCKRGEESSPFTVLKKLKT